MSDEANMSPVELAAELTIAWLGNQNNRISAEDVPVFLQKMHATVSELTNRSPTAPLETDEVAELYAPAVTVRKSLASKDHIISMIDGKPYKSLRRHLSAKGLTPEQYRVRYKLKADYPMVAESYSETRRAAAKRIGLGHKGRKSASAAPKITPAPRSKRAPLKLKMD